MFDVMYEETEGGRNTLTVEMKDEKYVRFG
jgi:hypothetical protein